jgi:CHAD domain-containing protein
VKGARLPPPAELLSDAAGTGARRVALALMEMAVSVRDHLDEPDDAEALHDFRVALRRTRSWMRAFDNEIGPSIRKKHRRRLAAISRAAGDARDAQVHATWLRDVEDSLRARERPGAEWLLHRITDQQRDADVALRAAIAEQFADTAAAVIKDLAVYTLRIDLRDPVPPQTMAHAMAPLVRAQANALGERLAAVQTIQDQAVAHAARIAGKRLRYLLEPIAEGVEGATALVKRLRILQDTIGEMHDVHVMAEQVIQAAEDAGADQARRVATALLEGAATDDAVRLERGRDPRPGLLAIAGQLRSRGQSAFGDLQQGWLGEHAQDLTDAARAVADRLMADGEVGPASGRAAGDTLGQSHLAELGDRMSEEAAHPWPTVVFTDDQSMRVSTDADQLATDDLRHTAGAYADAAVQGPADHVAPTDASEATLPTPPPEADDDPAAS